MNMHDLKAIGRRIIEMRRREGLTQEELAKLVGRGRGAIAGIEIGKDRGGIVLMTRLADYFKVPLDWLVGRRVPPGGPLVGQFVEEPDKLALLRFWDSLTYEEKRAVATTLRIDGIRSAGD
jgi:transcriptional regulator with XRE-family HTH domain